MLSLSSSHLVAATVLAAVGAVQAADTRLSRRDADAFQQKVVLIAMNGQEAERSAGARRTPLSESEVNSWFVYHAKPLLPTGISEPAISIVGQGKVAGRATVDLEAVAKQRASGGMLDPWGYIGGRVPVSVSGRLRTKDGKGRFELETAEVSGVPVPKTLLQELVTYYTRTPDHPDGLRLDDPFDLPASIRSIEVGEGQAVVVQ